MISRHRRDVLDQAQERALGVGVVHKSVRLDREKRRARQVVAGAAYGGRGESPGVGKARPFDRDAVLPIRTVALHDRECAKGDGDHDENGEQADGCSGKSACTSVLADVLTFEVVLGDAVHRRRQIRHRRTEPAVAQIQIRLAARPPQVQMARLVATARPATRRAPPSTPR